MDLHYEHMQRSNEYGNTVWVYASIQPPESLVGDITYNNALARNLTLHTQLRDKFAVLSLLLAGMHPSVIRRANHYHTRS